MEEPIDDTLTLRWSSSRWFPVTPRTWKTPKSLELSAKRALGDHQKLEKTEHSKSTFFMKNTQKHCTCGQKLHLRNSQNLEINFASNFLENRAFLKTAKPLELFAEMSALGLQKASKITKNRALEKHFLRGKHAQTLCLCTKTALSNFPKPQKKFRDMFSRNSRILENSKNARTVCENDPFGSPRGFQDRSRWVPLSIPEYSGIFLSTLEHTWALKSFSRACKTRNIVPVQRFYVAPPNFVLENRSFTS